MPTSQSLNHSYTPEPPTNARFWFTRYIASTSTKAIDERNTMKGHTCLGAQLFTPPDSDLDEMAREVCLCHHERWDGGDRGYPGHFDYNTLRSEQSVPISTPLKGEEIPLAARIVALADVFDALSHQRVYKEAWSLDDTFNEIEKERGRQFDPEVVDAFIQIKDRIVAINNAM